MSETGYTMESAWLACSSNMSAPSVGRELPGGWVCTTCVGERLLLSINTVEVTAPKQ